MKLLFFSVIRHQRQYFQKLSENIDIPNSCFDYLFPMFAPRYLLQSFKMDTEDILSDKQREVDAKYKNKFHRVLYKIFLRLQIPLVLSSCMKHIVVNTPTHVVLWNGKKFHQRLMLLVLESYNIKCIYFENGILPDTTTIDFKGVNADNSMPRDINFYKNYTEHKGKHLPQRLLPRKSKKRKSTFNQSLPKHYVFVPFQVAYDTQIILHSPWIKDMYKLYDLLERISSVLDVSFVIKEHPSDRASDYSSLHERSNRKIMFSSLETQYLIENADVVMSINSSVVIESLLFHKKVIVLGEAFFAIEGLVQIARTEQKVLELLSEVEEWSESAYVDNFLRYLYFEYLVHGDWKTPTLEHFKDIETKMYLCR